LASPLRCLARLRGRVGLGVPAGNPGAGRGNSPPAALARVDLPCKRKRCTKRGAASDPNSGLRKWTEIRPRESRPGLYFSDADWWINPSVCLIQLRISARS
jgi:hypothetical protein